MGGRDMLRAKKGAHYSAPPPCGAGNLPAAGRGWRSCSWAARLWRPRPPARKGMPARTEAQLEAVKAEIERITREVSAEQVERDRLTRELRGAELSVGEARAALLEVRRQRAEDAARRAALASREEDARDAACRQPRSDSPDRCARPISSAARNP